MHKRADRRGFYTVEAAIFLPLVILAILTLGYFIKTDSVWENAMNGAIDECSYCAATAYGSAPMRDAVRVRKRLREENEELSELKVKSAGERISFSGIVYLCLPAGFEHASDVSGRIKYRGFRGKKYQKNGMGTEGLESGREADPVTVFPKAGIRYHDEHCSYVRAAVKSCILTSRVRKSRSACSLCGSGSLPAGSLVYCFTDSDTAYHKGSCRCIDRHSAVIDRKDAVRRGYSPCSKCGG